MRIPKDSLEEFFANRAAPKPPPPPPDPVQLEFTGEVEWVKPLARWEPPIKVPAAAAETSAQPHLLSWFHRSLVFGGALATLVLVFGTGMFFALFGPAVDVVSGPAEVAVNELSLDSLVTDEEVDTTDLLANEESTFAYNEPFVVRSRAKRRAVRLRIRSYANRSRVLFAANRAPRRYKPVPKMIWSDFVPTNMIIFVENGEIKTRIEPQLTAVYKRVPTGSQQ